MKTFESYDSNHVDYAWKLTNSLYLTLHINRLCPWGFHFIKEYKSVSLRFNSYILKLHKNKDYKIIVRESK